MNEAGKWEGAEYWMPLAWALCAEENGEDACNELVWEGGPIPEPWGDRWLKYEDESKRLIALVHEHTLAAHRTASTAAPFAWGHPDGRVVPASTMDTARRDGGASASSLAGYTIPLVPASPASASPEPASTGLAAWVKADEQQHQKVGQRAADVVSVVMEPASAENRPVAQADAGAPKHWYELSPPMLVLGRTYATRDGRNVTMKTVESAGTEYETMADEHGHYRYSRSHGRVIGRLTGSDNDDPGNIVFSAPPALAASAQATQAVEPVAGAETLTKWRNWALGKGWSPGWDTITMCMELADEIGAALAVPTTGGANG